MIDQKEYNKKENIKKHNHLIEINQYKMIQNIIYLK